MSPFSSSLPSAVHVFAGPSLPPAFRTAWDQGVIVFHPPLAQADLASFVDTLTSPTTILILDAFYKDRPSIWHKEVLYALEQGHVIYGSSSLGAVRAVECERFGMKGLGRIFSYFKSGLLFDDADVALLHDNDDFRSYTVPICDLFAWVDNSGFELQDCISICNLARSIHYESRTISRLVTAVNADSSLSDSLKNDFLELISKNPLSQKIQDSIDSINTILGSDVDPNCSASPSFSLNYTAFFNALLHQDRSILGQSNNLLAARAPYLAFGFLNDPAAHSKLESTSLNHLIAAVLFDQMDLVVDDSQLELYRSDFLSSISESDYSLEDRIADYGLSQQDLTDYILLRYKSAVVLSNIHRFGYMYFITRGFFLHSALDPSSASPPADYSASLSSIDSLSLNPIIEASDSSEFVWPSELLNRLSSCYLGSTLDSADSISPGSFTDLPLAKSMQKILHNHRSSLIQLLFNSSAKS